MRRNSWARGREGVFWRPFSPRNVGRYLRAAERYDLAGRLAARADRNGRKIGPLGPVGLDVLRELLRLVSYRTGQLDPALATLAARTGHSIAGVVAALKRLRTHGFTDWLRRYEPTGNSGRGPQVRQTSNAYRLHLPPRAAALLDPEAPVPVDIAAEQARRAAEAQAMVEALPVGSRYQAEIGGALGATLDRWALRFERDSKQQ